MIAPMLINIVWISSAILLITILPMSGLTIEEYMYEILFGIDSQAAHDVSISETDSDSNQQDDNFIPCRWQDCDEECFEDELEQHIKQHLAVMKNIKIQGRSTVSCLWIDEDGVQCSAFYTSKNALLGHIASKHFAKKLYKCIKCKYCTNWTNELRKHKKKKGH